jgi:hypothetical protein
MNAVHGWLVGRLPDDWFEGEPEVTVDREEILVVGRLPKPVPTAAEPTADTGDEDSARSAEAGRIKRFREDTRAHRMKIADETEARFGRKVAWGAMCGETRTVFTNMSVPVMTRLRQPERMVLDTLVEAGVARSRSEALAWCVRLVGRHEADWIEQLREALGGVRQARESGPAA